jgi:hypothetical protein
MFRPSSSVSSSLGRGGMGSVSGGGGGGIDETTRQSNIVVSTLQLLLGLTGISSLEENNLKD